MFFSKQTLCRILYTFNRYARTSNYFWMFCEGFYLHRLILHAFHVPKTLTWYYIIGWGKLLTLENIKGAIKMDNPENLAT